MAQDGNWGGSRRVVLRGEHAPAEGLDSKCGEVIAAHVLRSKRSGGRLDALTAHTQASAPGLESGHLLKLRSLRLQAFIQRIREHAPLVLGTAFDAAIIAVADTVEPARIRNR